MPLLIVLPGDVVMGLILLLVVGYVVHAWASPPERRVWQALLRQPLALCSTLLLLGYLFVGMLDSIHWQEGPQAEQAGASSRVVSLLDAVLTPARTQVERSYSAPFSAYAYASEVAQVAGVNTWVKVRLQHGGSHLHDPAQDWLSDVLTRGATGLLLAWAAFAALLLCLPATWRLSLQSAMAWRSGLALLLLLTGLGGALIAWLPHYHVLGTDQVGNDVLYQALKSIRTGVVLGTLATLVGVPLAVGLGLAAGYFRGWVDDAVQYVYTSLSSIPSVLLIAASVLMLDVAMANSDITQASSLVRADFRLVALCLILGLTGWTGLCRLIRAEVLKLRELEFVAASRVLGVRSGTLLLRHLLPNVSHLILIACVLDFSGLVLAEAVLAYVNIGVDATTFSWGNMINKARGELARDPVVWWSLFAAFLFMFVLVLAANLLGDALREAHDPRLKRTP